MKTRITDPNSDPQYLQELAESAPKIRWLFFLAALVFLVISILVIYDLAPFGDNENLELLSLKGLVKVLAFTTFPLASMLCFYYSSFFWLPPGLGHKDEYVMLVSSKSSSGDS